MTNNYQLVVGIDEAGRGPLAGPVSVGAFGGDKNVGKWLLKNIFNDKLRDSKKLSPIQRYTIYRKLWKLIKIKKVFFAVSHISNKIIDKKGISYSVKLGISNCLKKLQHTSRWQRAPLTLRLDGLLKAPNEYKNQKTIIKGDEKDVFIACASIVAKVCRDRLMARLAKKYPKYAFEIHKGYGTALHRRLIQKHGLSLLHRKSFCKNLTK